MIYLLDMVDFPWFPSCVLNGPAEQRDGASDQHADANDHENDLSQAFRQFGQTKGGNDEERYKRIWWCQLCSVWFFNMFWIYLKTSFWVALAISRRVYT